MTTALMPHEIRQYELLDYERFYWIVVNHKPGYYGSERDKAQRSERSRDWKDKHPERVAEYRRRRKERLKGLNMVVAQGKE